MMMKMKMTMKMNERVRWNEGSEEHYSLEFLGKEALASFNFCVGPLCIYGV